MKLYSNIIGDGRAMLILHGFLGMGDNWKTLGSDFSEAGYQVHLIDQRNHGRSPHSEDFSYLDMAKDIREYIKDHELQDLVLMGHSMGGKTAMTVASLFPDLVDKLIIVDISPKYYPPHHQQILKGLWALEQSDLDSRGEAEEILAEHVKEKAVRMFLLKNLYRKQKDQLGLRINLKVLSEKIEELGAALPTDYLFSKSTLFIKGERSDYITSQDQALIKKQFPQAIFKEIPKSGHWVHAENKSAFFEAVCDFI